MSKLNDRYGALYGVQVVMDETTEGEACFVASLSEIPTCMAHGSTPEEATRNLAEARALYLDSLEQDGITPPAPAKWRNRFALPLIATWYFSPGEQGASLAYVSPSVRMASEDDAEVRVKVG